MNTSKWFVFVLVVFVHTTVKSQKIKDDKLNWQAGVSLASPYLKSDVAASFPQPGWGLFIRKPVVKWFALQVNYQGGIVKGMNWIPAFNYAKNPAWSAKYNAPVIKQSQTTPGTLEMRNSADGGVYTDGDPVYYNYSTTFHQLSLQTRFSYTIELIKPNIGFYFLAGAGMLSHTTMVDAEDASGTAYTSLFRSVNNQNQIPDRTSVINQLKKGMDGKYETKGEQRSDGSFSPTLQTGIGITADVNKRIQITLGYQWNFTRLSLLDGQQWLESPLGNAAKSKYFDRLNMVEVAVLYRF